MEFGIQNCDYELPVVCQIDSSFTWQTKIFNRKTQAQVMNKDKNIIQICFNTPILLEFMFSSKVNMLNAITVPRLFVKVIYLYLNFIS